MIKTVKEFKVWRAHFCYSPKGKSAIDGMKKVRQGDNEFPYANLESSVLSTCFLAAKYLPKKDQMDSRRRIGGLQLPVSAIKGNSKHKPKNVGRNSLILHLSTFLKFYTSDESAFDWVGKKIPDFGEDHPDLVSKFINAVYSDENIPAVGVDKFSLKSQKEGIRLAHWKLQD
jgi:restriction endonuclease S subunit